MDRNTFLVAATKAAEIRFRCEAAFSALRDVSASATAAKRRMQAIDQQLAQHRANPAARGTQAEREGIEYKIHLETRDRTEAANEFEIAQRIAGELEIEAQRLARQRDSTAAQIEQWRKELDAIEKKPTPSCMLPQVGPINARTTVIRKA